MNCKFLRGPREQRVWLLRAGGRALLVYLAAERISKDKWVSISYLDLASALRKVWRKNSHAAGQAWLGLYIAAVTNGLLEADVERRPQDVELDDLMDYLGKAH